MSATADTTRHDAATEKPAAKPEVPGLHRPTQRRRSHLPIGDVVVKLGFADREPVDRAIRTAREQGKRTGEMLVAAGVLTNDQLARVLAERFGIDYVDLTAYTVDMGAVATLEGELARRYQAIPIDFLDRDRLLLAMADPSNLMSIDDISMITGMRVVPAAVSVDDLRALMTRVQRLDQSISDVDDSDDLDMGPEDADSEAPAIKLVHQILAQAIEQGASDIHFDPEETEMRVLFRLDGVIHQIATVSSRMARRVVSRVKVMASLNIAERRLPQDGRLAINVDGRRVELRVVTLPLTHGEGIVMRVLDTQLVVRNLTGLGMLPSEEQRLRASLRRRRGAVLVTGPTGSGKSTTLYAAVGELNTGESTIITVEDPVESRIPHVKQLAVNAKVGMTFAAGLRAMLRADPDIIMVGEIRDEETAQIAVQAAITGHLVLSTLHTRDAPSALHRLLDMGIPPFVVSSAVDCVVAQRLMRRLCEECKRPITLPAAVIEQFGMQDATPHDAVGCVRCGGTGYHGRLGVFEVMTMNEEIRQLVLERRSLDEITHAALRAGMRRLRDDALDKVKSGDTSMLELGRVTSLS